MTSRGFHFEDRHFQSLRLKTASNSVQHLYKPLLDPAEDAQPYQELTQGSRCQENNRKIYQDSGDRDTSDSNSGTDSEDHGDVSLEEDTRGRGGGVDRRSCLAVGGVWITPPRRGGQRGRRGSGGQTPAAGRDNNNREARQEEEVGKGREEVSTQGLQRGLARLRSLSQAGAGAEPLLPPQRRVVAGQLGWWGSRRTSPPSSVPTCRRPAR